MLARSGTHFSLRWGTFILRGSAASTPPTGDAPIDVTKLCDVSLEPECTSDVRGAFPLALAALRRELTTEANRLHAPLPVVETPGGEGRAPPLGAREIQGKPAAHPDRVLNRGPALGEMTEWPKVHDWKSCVGASSPRVRIPLSPQRSSEK